MANHSLCAVFFARIFIAPNNAVFLFPFHVCLWAAICMNTSCANSTRLLLLVQSQTATYKNLMSPSHPSLGYFGIVTAKDGDLEPSGYHSPSSACSYTLGFVRPTLDLAQEEKQVSYFSPIRGESGTSAQNALDCRNNAYVHMHVRVCAREPPICLLPLVSLYPAKHAKPTLSPDPFSIDACFCCCAEPNGDIMAPSTPQWLSFTQLWRFVEIPPSIAISPLYWVIEVYSHETERRFMPPRLSPVSKANQTRAWPYWGRKERKKPPPCSL